ncbi:hypothetical protein N7520_008625 [Penicillium odoratum]|uniref:uncharacterized protein n=1 Tax=Penicillium odoratum TaxID=1167516 RepID=UPI002548D95F|nr:uncharacterized protein N7520_008625 [Penicillium odoratum]KAJ5751708.1 hypothetical protein N7520_008625 [Penicillium odoratum]
MRYGLLQSVASIELEAQTSPGAPVGCWGGYEMSMKRYFVFEKPGPGAGMVIHLGGPRFLLIGWGFQARARAWSFSFTGFLSFREKVVDKGEVRLLRVLNGDEARSGKFAMMPNEDSDCGGFPICMTISARTK